MKRTIQEEWPEAGSYCWGCGRNNSHGLQLKSYWEDDETVATWTPDEHHLAFPGVLNGGIISTLIDCHGTGTANALGRRDAHDTEIEQIMYVTSGLSVRFIRPTPLDKPVTVRGRIKENTGERITVSCSLYSDDLLCATGEVFTVRVNMKTFLQ